MNLGMDIGFFELKKCVSTCNLMIFTSLAIKLETISSCFDDCSRVNIFDSQAPVHSFLCYLIYENRCFNLIFVFYILRLGFNVARFWTTSAIKKDSASCSKLIMTFYVIGNSFIRCHLACPLISFYLSKCCVVWRLRESLSWMEKLMEKGAGVPVPSWYCRLNAFSSRS